MSISKGVGDNFCSQFNIVNLSMFPVSKTSMYLTLPLKITLLVLTLTIAACDAPDKIPVPQTDDTIQSLNAGYGILHATLRDEHHLKTIRLAKTIVMLKSVTEPTSRIIDDIAQTSSAALDELEKLAPLSPEIMLDENNEGQIERAIRDALRITTAKELFTSKEDFEVILLSSQLQALRILSHLASELHEIETNNSRKVWLNTLSDQFEKLYLRVLSRLKIA
ncbi:MAG: hypothetical protein ABFS24_04165 [Pseudomonadota bacterium]